MFSRMSMLVGAASCALAGVHTVSASTINASRVEHFSQGLRASGLPVPLERSDPGLALGSPQVSDTLNFVSLGFEGVIVLGFDMPFTDHVQIVETTFNNPALHPEACEVFVGVGETWDSAEYFSLGMRLNTEDDVLMPLDSANIVSGTTAYNFLMIHDRSNPGLLPPDADGYDVDGVIAVAAVPAPAGAAVGLLGLTCGVARRARRRSA